MEHKTHWLKSPNKNYLGHWDLPENDLILTIKSAGWEDVKDPTNGKVESKRVVHFVEAFKPLICNETNAKAIFKSIDVRYVEDSKGTRITLYIGKVKDRKRRVEIDCVRVREGKVAPLKTVDDFPGEKIAFEQCENMDDLKKLFMGLDRKLQNLFTPLKDLTKKRLETKS